MPPCAASALMALFALAAARSAPRAEAPPPPLLQPPVERLVVDVDAGADDAVALLALLGAERRASLAGPAAPKTEAVTASNGNSDLNNVLRNIFRVLETVDRLDLPVYAGASESLVFTPKSDNYFGADGFGDIGGNRTKYDTMVQKDHAVNFLNNKVSANPGEITLLALGPLTNVALAERMRKGFVCQLRHLVWLGGSVEGRGNVRPAVEFNTFMDPEALYVTLDASRRCGRPLLIVPWEAVLLRINLTIGWRREVLGALPSPGVQLLNAVERASLDKPAESRWISADALAAGVTLAPALATLVSPPLHVGVALGDGAGRATLQVDYGNVTGNAPNARIVQEVDEAALQRLLLANLA